MQIGPKIRVGGTLGKIGEGIKKVVPSPGALIGGAALGGVGSVAGSLAGGVSPLDDAKKGAALALPIAAGVTALNGTSGSGGAPGTPAGGAGGTPPDPSSVNPLDPATEAAISKTPEGKSLLDQFKAGLAPLSALLDFAKKYAPVAVEVLAAKAAHDRQAQSDKYAQQGLDLAKEHYAQNAPLRDAGRSGMLSAGAYKPDLTKLNSLAGSGYSGPGSTLPMATPRQQPGTLPIAAGPPAPTPTPSGIGPRMPLPQGPQAPPPIPGAPTGAPPNPGTLPIAGMPPIPNLTRKPTLPFAQPGY